MRQALLLTPQQGTARQLVSLHNQQTQSSLTLKYFVTLLQLLEQVILVTKLVHLASGAQIVAAQTDEILDGGTTVVAHNVTVTSLVLQTQDGTTAPASVQYTDAERTIYCNITNTVDATTAGSFTFIIEYVQIA